MPRSGVSSCFLPVGMGLPKCRGCVAAPSGIFRSVHRDAHHFAPSSACIQPGAMGREIHETGEGFEEDEEFDEDEECVRGAARLFRASERGGSRSRPQV